jgi:hypothetical protein
MIERREYCIDILQQTAALRAAVDSVALLDPGGPRPGLRPHGRREGRRRSKYIEEVLDVVRRALGKAGPQPSRLTERVATATYDGLHVR